MSVVTLAPTIAKINLRFKQGAGAQLLLTVVDQNHQPIMDPSQAHTRATIKDSSGDLFVWDSAGGMGVGAASIVYSLATQKSILTLKVTGDQTADFTFWLARWDCFLTMPGHEPSCLAEGSVTVDPATTI